MLVGFGKTMVDHSNPTLDAHASNQRKLVDPKTFCFPIHTYMCYIQYIYYILMFIRCVFVHIMFNVHIQQYNYPFFRRIYIYIHTCRHVFCSEVRPQEAFSLAVEQKWITLLLLLLALRALQRAAVDPPPPMSRGVNRRGTDAEGVAEKRRFFLCFGDETSGRNMGFCHQRRDFMGFQSRNYGLNL